MNQPASPEILFIVYTFLHVAEFYLIELVKELYIFIRVTRFVLQVQMALLQTLQFWLLHQRPPLVLLLLKPLRFPLPLAIQVQEEDVGLSSGAPHWLSPCLGSNSAPPITDSSLREEKKGSDAGENWLQWIWWP